MTTQMSTITLMMRSRKRITKLSKIGSVNVPARSGWIGTHVHLNIVRTRMVKVNIDVGSEPVRKASLIIGQRFLGIVSTCLLKTKYKNRNFLILVDTRIKKFYMNCRPTISNSWCLKIYYYKSVIINVPLSDHSGWQ